MLTELKTGQCRVLSQAGASISQYFTLVHSNPCLDFSARSRLLLLLLSGLGDETPAVQVRHTHLSIAWLAVHDPARTFAG